MYKTVVWFITIVVKEGQKKLNVSYSKSTIISVTNHTDETINIKYSNRVVIKSQGPGIFPGY